MSAQIGPIQLDRIVLCSADAHPDSQRATACRADHFFPGGKWVGAVRNAADRLGCQFVILTTGYGLVTRETVLERYDKHIPRIKPMSQTFGHRPCREFSKAMGMASWFSMREDAREISI